MTSHEFKELLDKFSQGTCSPEEEKLIQDWYDNIGGPLHERIKSDSIESIEAKLWSNIKPRPLGTEKSYAFYVTRIAAAIIIMLVAGLGAYVGFQDSGLVKQNVASRQDRSPSDATLTRISNDKTTPSEITLEEGSQVTLQPKSEILFAKKFPAQRREVYLKGEAFFNVKRDEQRPFVVYSNEIVTQVLGTSFTIKAYEYEKEVTVAVKTGKVSVYANPKGEPVGQIMPTVILAPNQQVVYDRRKAVVVKQLVKEPEIILPNSKLFKMSFDEVPVTKIFKVLEENYGVDIVYDEAALKKCTLTTAMSDEGLYQRIEVICRAIKAEYTVTDAVIFIKSPGCD
jgi:transmembrane sensor